MNATERANSLSLAWIHGYVCGMEATANGIQTYMASGIEPDRAALLAQVACLNFCLDLANSFKDREALVRMFRAG